MLNEMSENIQVDLGVIDEVTAIAAKAEAILNLLIIANESDQTSRPSSEVVANVCWAVSDMLSKIKLLFK